MCQISHKSKGILVLHAGSHRSSQKVEMKETGNHRYKKPIVMVIKDTQNNAICHKQNNMHKAKSTTDY